jgi:hypothetical protein
MRRDEVRGAGEPLGLGRGSDTRRRRDTPCLLRSLRDDAPLSQGDEPSPKDLKQGVAGRVSGVVADEANRVRKGQGRAAIRREQGPEQTAARSMAAVDLAVS